MNTEADRKLYRKSKISNWNFLAVTSKKSEASFNIKVKEWKKKSPIIFEQNISASIFLNVSYL